MKFKTAELKDSQLELLGMTRKDFLTLPQRTVNALLSGGRTSLMQFNKINVPGLEGQSLEAKLSLERTASGEVNIRIHPINHVPKNSFNLSSDEVYLLRNEDAPFVRKKIGDNEFFIALDRQTNEYVAINTEKVQAPTEINGILLTEEQKTDYKNGKEIEVGGNKFRLNPTEELGISPTDINSTVTSLRFKHSKFGPQDLMIDLALLSTGAGSIVMLGHLTDLFFNSTVANYKNSRDNMADLLRENKSLNEAFAKASPEISEKIKKGEFMSPKEIKVLIENHLNQPIDLHFMKDIQVKEAYPYPNGIKVDAINEHPKPSKAHKEGEEVHESNVAKKRSIRL